VRTNLSTNTGVSGTWIVSEWFPTLGLPLASAQNGNTSAAKIMGQEIVKLLPEK